MIQISGNRQRLPKLMVAIAGIVVIATTAWWMMPAQRTETGPGEDAHQQNGAEISRARPDRGNGTNKGTPGRTTAGNRSKESAISEEDEEGPQFPLVDEILAQEGSSNEEAARRLLEIVENKDLSVMEREEALAHGLHLDFSRFVGLVADPHLPQPLAQRFFDEMLNYNEHRDMQVRACISLVDHEDEALREEAAEKLAFYIGLEEWAENPEVLKQEAHAFLEDLAKRPPPEPEPVDPDADIPETAPINPLEGEEESDEATGEGPAAGE